MNIDEINYNKCLRFVALKEVTTTKPQVVRYRVTMDWKHVWGLEEWNDFERFTSELDHKQIAKRVWLYTFLGKYIVEESYEDLTLAFDGYKKYMQNKHFLDGRDN